MSGQLFAVERYDDSGVTARPPRTFPPLPDYVKLVGVMHMPTDGVVLALVEATNATSVDVAVTAAGWRADRIIPVSWVIPPLAEQDGCR
jgi:hypothetical protein